VQYTTLGRSGLRVSRVGLGCGGPSRLGQSQGHSAEDSKRVIRRALELGVTLFDTAESYRTEALLGEALAEAGASERVVVSTKKGVWDWDRKQLCTPREMLAGIDASLERLRRERIEIFHLHGLELEHVDYALREIVPALREAQARGKILHLAVSEAFSGDTTHRMFQRVLPEDLFDVVMVGFNLLNPSARQSVLPLTRERRVGTLIMFAVRRALTNMAHLRTILDALIAEGKLAADALDKDAPLGFLDDVRDAAYRFCSHEPGADVVLTGTGSVAHLEENLKSLAGPPLPVEQRERLAQLFGQLDSVSGN
jgi:aryl-alcohol dehydrogenase-like predicted oxidoreductase